MGSLIDQSLPTIPSQATLPSYPPLEMSQQGNDEIAADSDTETDNDSAELTDQLALLGIAPNPFNPIVQLDFGVPADGRSVSLTIHGIDGRLVSRLVDTDLRSGTHTISWRARDDEGRRLPSGVYIARLNVGGEVTLRKMLLVK